MTHFNISLGVNTTDIVIIAIGLLATVMKLT